MGNLFANLLATEHEKLASNGSNHVSDDMTADLLSSIIENTVNSSEHESIAETDTLNTPLMDEMINTPLNDVMINTPLMKNEHIIDDPYMMPTHTTATNGKENHGYP